MKTLRALIAEAIGEVDSQTHVKIDAELVEASVRATRDWLAQPEILGVISNGIAVAGTVGGAALALRREAV